MKPRHVITGTILMMIFLLLQTTPVFASSYEGKVDGVNGNVIFGWAWNPSKAPAPVDVRVVVTKEGTSEIVLDTTVTADQFRDDLAAAGKGAGNHSFTVEIDWSSLEDCAYTIEAFIGNFHLPVPLIYKSGQTSPADTGLTSLGIFKTTGYCPCTHCSAGWGQHTSSGSLATAGHTIAVDTSVIPYGTKLMINGVIYTAEDRGGGVRGNHIDIYFNTHGEASQYGLRNAEVFLVS